MKNLSLLEKFLFLFNAFMYWEQASKYNSWLEYLSPFFVKCLGVSQLFNTNSRIGKQNVINEILIE